MKILLLILSVFITSKAYSEVICWETKVDERYVEYFKIKDSDIQFKPEGKYVRTCVDFEKAQKEIKYAGAGGGCGGSSKCGSNFLVLDDFILELTNPTKHDKAIKPWKMLSGNTDTLSKVQIAKSIDAAKKFIKQRKSNEMVIMSNNLDTATDSALRYQFNVNKKFEIDIMKNFSKDKLEQAEGLQISVEKMKEVNSSVINITIRD